MSTMIVSALRQLVGHRNWIELNSSNCICLWPGCLHLVCIVTLAEWVTILLNVVKSACRDTGRWLVLLLRIASRGNKNYVVYEIKNWKLDRSICSIKQQLSVIFHRRSKRIAFLKSVNFLRMSFSIFLMVTFRHPSGAYISQMPGHRLSRLAKGTTSESRLSIGTIGLGKLFPVGCAQDSRRVP